jgi:DNA-directed RNA polymerase alpha subunit
VERTSDDLLNITNIAHNTLDDVIVKLDELGLSLADAPSGGGD